MCVFASRSLVALLLLTVGNLGRDDSLEPGSRDDDILEG
jgi:hypothetical protein